MKPINLKKERYRDCEIFSSFYCTCNLLNSAIFAPSEAISFKQDSAQEYTKLL